MKPGRPFLTLECLNDQCTSCGRAAGRCDCSCHVQTATNHAALYTALGIEAP